MTRAEAIAHNDKVIREIINALVDFRLADPYDLIINRQYVLELIGIYLEAANIARSMMHMEPLVLYSVNDIDEE